MNIESADLLNFGAIVALNEERTVSEDSLTGYFLHSDSVEFINRLDILKGAIGLSFGIEYILNGFNDLEHEDVHFISRITHPTITNPITNVSISETIEHKYNYLNQKNFDYFVFEYG